MGVFESHVRYNACHDQGAIDHLFMITLQEQNTGLKTLDGLNLNNQRVLIREDFNVPIQNGIILSDARLIAALPTLKALMGKNARILILSHLGRPKEGEYNSEFSLKPVATRLSQLLNHPIRLEKNWLNAVTAEPGEIVLCENVRFSVGEKSNDEKLAKQMASLCDIFVMDAFATAHRAEASTVGVARYAPIAVAGPLLMSELTALDRVLKNPKRPVVAIVGGAKISSKFPILKSLLPKVDTLIVGGGIANTLIALQHPVGSSLIESNGMDMARELQAAAKEANVRLLVPIDGVVAKEATNTALTRITHFTDCLDNEKILDVGPATSEVVSNVLQNAGTILWNGPIGVFECEPFSMGTKKLAEAIALSTAFSVAGGGETLEAIDKYQVGEKISYISTGGGAFLEYLEGKILPAVAVLQERAKK